MTRQEKIIRLKELKYYLIMYKEYKPQDVEEKIEEKENDLDKPKVLVLKKSYHGKMLKVG
ncbi:MAG: hypothetical protein IJ134_04440 [Bacilli bacterium]|nr:hypothetical protein [Bacilli bacterium]